MGRLEGKVAIVTGAASGIGRGIAEKFASEGAHMVLADINEQGMTVVAKAMPSVETVLTNTVSESDVERMVATAVQRFGRLDIAVNCAGGGTYAGQAPKGAPGRRLVRSPFWEQPLDMWQRTVDLTFVGTLSCMKHEAKQMIAQGEGGAIVNIVSISARQPGEGMLAYCSAKAGVETMIRCAAMELGSAGIRVTGIGPGLIRTPATEVVWDQPAVLEAYVDNIPLGRTGKPEDIANAALFLASDEATWISGDTLFVDGGSLTRQYPRLFEAIAADSA
jgi:NAD(P)-dependent dehydrogenase (short-subunit alcohol dehydrogenase family)